MSGEYASDKGDLAWRRIIIKYINMLVRNYSPTVQIKVLWNNIQPNYKHEYTYCIHTWISGPNQSDTIRIYRCMDASSSSSVGTTNLVGFGLLNCRWAFSAGRFYRVPLTVARQIPNLEENQDLEPSNFRHKRPPASETMLANPAAEGGTTSEKWPRILPKVTTFGFFYMP
jgi:hypothetical protein